MIPNFCSPPQKITLKEISVIFILRMKLLGAWRCLGPCTARPSRLDSRPGRSALCRPRPEGGGHPRSQGEGTPNTPEQAALNRPPQRSPRAATPLPHCPAALAAPLPVTCGRREEAGCWLRRAGLGPSTHSLLSTEIKPHHQGPETGQQTGLQFLRRHHRGARTRNRARAAAQVMLGSVSSSGLGAGEACAARLFPAVYSGCKEIVCVCF